MDVSRYFSMLNRSYTIRKKKKKKKKTHTNEKKPSDNHICVTDGTNELSLFVNI